MKLTREERAIVITALHQWQRVLEEDPAWNHVGNSQLPTKTAELISRFERAQEKKR